MLSRNLVKLARTFESRIVAGSFGPESAQAFLASLQVAARQAEQLETPPKPPAAISGENIVPFRRPQ